MAMPASSIAASAAQGYFAGGGGACHARKLLDSCAGESARVVRRSGLDATGSTGRGVRSDRAAAGSGRTAIVAAAAREGCAAGGSIGATGSTSIIGGVGAGTLTAPNSRDLT